MQRLLLFLGLEIGYAPVFGGQSDLKVLGGEPVAYDCGRNATITARYYQLSDESLRFAKVDTPEGNYTLPQLVSGSGARYTDEFRAQGAVPRSRRCAPSSNTRLKCCSSSEAMFQLCQ